MSEVKLLLGDCLELMKDIPDKSIDAVITDPPYGCGKASWDTNYPTDWYKTARELANILIVITGSAGLKDTIPMVGEDFIDVISAWNTNSRTRSPIGFSNWIAAVIAKSKPKQQQNVMRFSIRGQMPEHPSPKPIEYMRLVVERMTNKGDTILDPFMGSGTTGVACVQTGRNFIGMEIEPKYFEIAEKRIHDAQQQMRLPL
jgi:DNA modification methylase